MYVNERPGRIRVVRDGRLLPRPLAEISTSTSGETGLLGIAVSPDERHVYAFATSPDGVTNEVLRVPVDGGEVETVIEGLPASAYHNGGGVAFDADGMLLVSNGEQHDTARSQDPGVLGGKVYRFTPEGDVPRDNPFGRSPAFAIGLRNPYGLTVDPLSGDPFVTENGPESYDEVNRIVAGGNYGWPVVSGPARGEGVEGLAGSYRDPLLSYPEIVVPTGIAFADPDSARPAFRGDLFFATYGEGAIHRVRFDEAREEVASDEVLLRPGEPVIALAWGPRGLYYSTPEEVSVLPLAASREERSESPAPRRSPERPADGDGGARSQGRDEPRSERQGSPMAVVLQVLVAALLVAVLAWSLRSGLRRRA